jgi:hypothetical protein
MSPSVAMVTGMSGLDGLTDGIKIYRMVDGFLLFMFYELILEVPRALTKPQQTNPCEYGGHTDTFFWIH